MLFSNYLFLQISVQQFLSLVSILFLTLTDADAFPIQVETITSPVIPPDVTASLNDTHDPRLAKRLPDGRFLIRLFQRSRDYDVWSLGVVAPLGHTLFASLGALKVAAHHAKPAAFRLVACEDEISIVRTD